MRTAPWLAAALVLLPMALAAPAIHVTTTWDTLAPVPVARTEVAAAQALGKVYVMGGFTGNGAGSARVDVYETVTNAWSLGPSLPYPMHHTQAVALGSRILVIGGYPSQLPGFTPHALVWMLDTALPLQAQAWVPFPPLPEARGAHAAATDGCAVYVAGGTGPQQNQLATQAYMLPCVGGVTIPAWVRIADFPDPRDHLAGAVLGGKFYVVGGRDLTLTTNTGRMDVYDPAANAWSQGPSMPTARGGIAGAIAGGLVWVFGGEHASGATFCQAEGYSPTANAWVSGTPMPTCRHGLGAAALGDAIYVEAGGPIAGLTVTDKNERLRVQ
ncbi:MAG TPA: kelch repeat-containing protein [Candidatus Thermoplasmatota archaeon]|jgi:N-acetylneuraminic acid mutarotase|nr:kelch repeat-containing protein [Candidatus Thermoplasmatota archaeon]